MLNICGNEVKRDELDNTIVRPEWASSRWQGIPHKALADLFVETAETSGLQVIDEQWSLQETSDSLIGGLTVASTSLPATNEMSYSLALIHDNTGCKALRVMAGASVFICQNGIVTGDELMRKKHTIGLDLAAEVRMVVESAMDRLKTVLGSVDSMKKTELLATGAEALFVEAGRRKLMTWTRIGRVVAEHDNPSCSEFEQYKDTGWGAYNAFNQIVKSINNPISQAFALRGFTQIFKEFGILDTNGSGKIRTVEANVISVN